MAHVEAHAEDLQAQLSQLVDDVSKASAQSQRPTPIDNSMRALFWRPLGIATGIVVSVSVVTTLAMKFFF